MSEIFRMIGRYEDGHETHVSATSEEVCMAELIDLQDKHGRLVWYSEDLDAASEERIAWAAYCDYLIEWATIRRDNAGFAGSCPACYEEFLEEEYEEANT